jgi:uncharacterized protein with HEPN domain
LQLTWYRCSNDITKHEDAFYIEAILEHIEAIKACTPSSKDVFLRDEKTYDAILMRLIALGEELAHVSDAFHEKYPEQQWHRIIGLRNRIAHGYFEVDKDTIWEILTNGSLDALQELLEA